MGKLGLGDVTLVWEDLQALNPPGEEGLLLTAPLL